MENEPAPQAHPPAKHYISLIASAIIAVCLVGGALYWRHASAQNNTPNKAFTAGELAQFDGENGNKCYVAVDDTVYEIEQGRLWNNGKHESSEGKASCGRDLTDLIGQSPHGRSKLSALKKVGTLQ